MTEITKEELQEFNADELEELAKENGVSLPKSVTEIKTEEKKKTAIIERILKVAEKDTSDSDKEARATDTSATSPNVKSGEVLLRYKMNTGSLKSEGTVFRKGVTKIMPKNKAKKLIAEFPTRFEIVNV